jgi:hypothetical protein
MLAGLGVDNPAVEAADATAPREAFLRPPPWTASSPFTGYRRAPGADLTIRLRNSRLLFIVILVRMVKRERHDRR